MRANDTTVKIVHKTTHDTVTDTCNANVFTKRSTPSRLAERINPLMHKVAKMVT